MAKYELKSQYDTLIKRANQRLRQLEKSGKENTSAYSYIKDLQSKGRSYIVTDKHGNVKFRTDTSKLNPQQLSNEILQVERFLQAKTSTVKGITKLHQKAYKTFKQKYGLTKEKGFDENTFTFNDYLTLYKVGIVKSFNDKYGSDATSRIIKVKLQEGYDINQIEQHLTNNLGEPLFTVVDQTKYNATFQSDDYLKTTKNPFEEE